MAIKISEFLPGRDDREVIDLRAKVWGSDHPSNSEAYFKWLFQSNPMGAGSGVLLRRGGTLIGFSGILHRRMQICGTETPVAQCVDFMVDASARAGISGVYGIRLMERWAELAISRGYRFGLGFPNQNSARLATSSILGWQIAFSPTLLVRPFASMKLPERPIAGMPPLLAAGGLAALAGLSSVSQSLRVRLPVGRAMTLANFDASLDEVLADMRTSPECGTLPDLDYLNWRYAQHPLARYDRVGWHAEGRMRGFAVTVLRDVFGIKTSLLVDLATVGSMPEVEFALIDETIRRAKTAGASMMATLAVHGSERYRRLVRFGFIPVPKRLDPKPFVFATLKLADEQMSRQIENANWRFNWADMDVV